MPFGLAHHVISLYAPWTRAYRGSITPQPPSHGRLQWSAVQAQQGGTNRPS